MSNPEKLLEKATALHHEITELAMQRPEFVPAVVASVDVITKLSLLLINKR